MKKYLTFLIILIAGISSCSNEDMSNNVIDNPGLAKILKSSPETLKIGNNDLTLSTFLWRDFMPSTDIDESGLYCTIQLKDQTNGITLKKIYVVKNNEVWICDNLEIRHSPGSILEGYAKNGPKWEPGINVDVICEFEYQGETFRILANSQLIHETS